MEARLAIRASTPGMTNPAKRDRADWLWKTFEVAESFLNLEEDEPVTTFRTPRALSTDFDFTLSDDGRSLEDVFSLLGRVMAATPKSTTRRFWNQLFAGRDVPSTAAEMLTVLLNSSMYTFKAAGPHILIEHELTRHMLGKIGFSGGGGMFAPGGSLSNMAAMIVARNVAQESCRDRGHAGTPLVAYASAEAHYSIKKNAGLIGTGRDNVRHIPTDGRGRMRPDALEDALARDLRAGNIPYIVIATAGTTVPGAFDPIPPLAAICERHTIWLHIDGAMGGSIILSSQGDLLEGSELADSFTWDAHKMMGVPLLCSSILFRDKDILLDHFDEAADYLFQPDGVDLDPGTKSMQCGRRNDALKLWAAWKFHGDAGFKRVIDHLFMLTRYAASIVEADPSMTLAREPESVTLCFECDATSSVAICDLLRKENRQIIGYAIVDGRYIIRLACFNADATTEDIDRLFEDIREVAHGLGEASNAVSESEQPVSM